MQRESAPIARLGVRYPVDALICERRHIETEMMLKVNTAVRTQFSVLCGTTLY
jgi:hypothetical protein